MENNNQEVVKPKSHLVLIIVVGVILIVGTYLLFKLVLNKDTTSEVEEGTISFDSTSYSCIEGQDLEATITVEGGMVKEYNSSNPLVASIRKHPFKSVKCANCVLVEIKCSRKGEATLSTTSTKGAKAEAKLLVIEKGLIDLKLKTDIANGNEKKLLQSEIKRAKEVVPIMKKTRSTMLRFKSSFEEGMNADDENQS